jgi:SAM-dependent methyltransferase
MSNIYIKQVLFSLREVGFYKTLRFIAEAVYDLFFDMRYGTRTAGWTSLGNLQVAGPNRDRGGDYHPSNVKPLERLFNTLDLPRDCSFVDFGCGKGRVLMVAMKYGFATVRGIEFAPSLCEVARRNMASLSRRNGHISNVEIICEDAVNYRVCSDDSVFYFFNPFDESLFLEVVSNIENSLKKYPRKMCMIYANPIHREYLGETAKFLKFRPPSREVIEESTKFLQQKKMYTIGVRTFLVCENEFRSVRPENNPETPNG